MSLSPNLLLDVGRWIGYGKVRGRIGEDLSLSPLLGEGEIALDMLTSGVLSYLRPTPSLYLPILELYLEVVHLMKAAVAE